MDKSSSDSATGSLPYLKKQPNPQQVNHDANDPLNSDEAEAVDLGQARELYGSEREYKYI